MQPFRWVQIQVLFMVAALVETIAFTSAIATFALSSSLAPWRVLALRVCFFVGLFTLLGIYATPWAIVRSAPGFVLYDLPSLTSFIPPLTLTLIVGIARIVKKLGAIEQGVLWPLQMKENKWMHLLAVLTGLVNQEQLLQNQYLAAGG